MESSGAQTSALISAIGASGSSSTLAIRTATSVIRTLSGLISATCSLSNRRNRCNQRNQFKQAVMWASSSRTYRPAFRNGRSRIRQVQHCNRARRLVGWHSVINAADLLSLESLSDSPQQTKSGHQPSRLRRMFTSDLRQALTRRLR